MSIKPDSAPAAVARSTRKKTPWSGLREETIIQ